MKPIKEQGLNSNITQNRYLVSLVAALLAIWVIVLTGFHFYLEISFPTVQVFTLLLLMALTLVLFQVPNNPLLKLKPKKLALHAYYFLLLCWVLLLNSALLYFTGGKINPLIHLLLLPLVFGMLLLPALYFLLLALIATTLYMLLNYFYVPIMSLKMQSLQVFFSWHLHGSMLVFIVLVLILAVVIWPLKARLEKQTALLEKKRTQALQEEYLLATASLAAASVHKLSTPLNSLQILQDLLAAEVKSEQGKDYLNMAGEQISVCINSLQSLRDKANHAGDKRLEGIPLQDLVMELREEFALLHPQSELMVDTVEQNEKLFVDPTFKLAMLNLCDNAARYSPDYIHLSVEHDSNNWLFVLEDQGGGLNEEALRVLGYGQYDDSYGMGMGVFISRMIIERFGGEITFENAVVEQYKGLKVLVSLPVVNDFVEGF